MIKIKQSELDKRDLWVQKHITGDILPFSFVYNKRSSKEILPIWEFSFETSKENSGIVSYDNTWIDTDTGLQVKCSAKTYPDYPIVEWTVYIKNNGSEKTPILEEIRGVNISFDNPSRHKFLMRTLRGDTCTNRAFEPISIDLSKVTTSRFTPIGGRSSNIVFPYFNVEWENQGIITAIGWPGQWEAFFDCNYHISDMLNFYAGQEDTCMSLNPGEEIRTPLTVLMFWEDDYVRSQNIWRRFMVDYNVPRPGGELLGAKSAFCLGTVAEEKQQINAMLEYSANGVKQDFWWMDAGWYPNENWYTGAGTWEPCKKRFPNGLKPVTDAVHADGRRYVLWFEPERASKGSWLYENHPEWLLGSRGENDALMGSEFLLDLGNPDALNWLIDHVDGMIKDIGIDMYRNDFNIEPLRYWRYTDAPDRKGVTENLYCQGFLKYFDELTRRNPGLSIDNCASGGRRNDIETLRRGIPLTRSDLIQPHFMSDTTIHDGNQCLTYGLSFWIPYHGNGAFYEDRYCFLSHLSVFMHIGYSYDTTMKPLVPVDWEMVRDTERIWKEVADSFLGDYYTLTDYSLSEDVWMAWQLNRSELGEGFVQAFRREFAIDDGKSFILYDLDAAAEYEVTDVQKQTSTIISGLELMNKGLHVVLPESRQPALIKYKKI